MPYNFDMVEQDAAKLNVGPRIRALRERCALTLSAVRERTGIGVSSLSELETGKRDPTVVQLKSLAECFHASIADLLSDAEVEPMAVRWRERPADGAAAMEARFEQLCRQYCQLERWADEELSVQLPCAPVYPRTAGEVEALARRVRAQLNLGDRPGLALRTALEDDCGVKLFHARFDPAGKAACAWHPEYGPAILLDARDSAARRTFDLAHELFHLLTWGVQRARPNEELDEQFAGVFASALLMPEDALREAIERRRREIRISSANLCELARDFGVSIDALIRRAHRVYGWKDGARTEALIADARRALSAYRDLTPDRDDEAPELPERYRALAIQCLRRGDIAVGRAAEYLGIRRWAAMKYVELPGNHDEVTLPDP